MGFRILSNNAIKFSNKKLQRCLNHGFRKQFCSTELPEAEAITKIPLSKPLPGMPKPTFAVIDSSHTETKITTLDNGLRVASENKFGQFGTIGVVLDSGSRYEVNYPSGITHVLEKLGFGTTSKFESKDTILQRLENIGGMCDCVGSRDALIYAISAVHSGLPEVVEILSQVVLSPQVTDPELEAARQAIQFEQESQKIMPNPESMIMEMIHKAAYSNNTLGLPKMCPLENVNLIDRATLYTYMSQYHTPDRMVLAGVGIDHNKLVEMAQKHFVETKPVWEEHSDLIDRSKKMDLSKAQYFGATDLEEFDLSNVSFGENALPELVHVAVGLETCSYKDDDFIAYSVLNMLMGGGGSFSAGGPGKGMYSRLYLNVLNKQHWVFSCTAQHLPYEDSGLFYIHGSADPDSIHDLTETIIKEYVKLLSGVNNEELDRAKKQLQSMVLINLENKPVMFEDIGRQVLGHNMRRNAQYYIDEIGKVSTDDIVRVSQKMLKTAPSVAAMGKLAKLPKHKAIWTALNSQSGKIPQKYSLFA